MSLTQYLADHGGFVSPKISQVELHGRGKSIVAQSEILSGEPLVRLPRTLLMNVQTLSDASDSPLTSHQLLAKTIYSQDTEWTRELPQDFSSFPAMWPDAELALLPEKYRARALAQRTQMAADQERCGLTDTERFRRAWLCVNSRCLYWDVGRDREENMTMAPFVDFLNHDCDLANSVKLENVRGRNMTVRAVRDYTPGTEICLSYGAHENGFLLCEYGFVANPNNWDYVDVTPQILEILPQDVQACLKKHGYLGDYSVDRSGPSFRTTVALAALQDTGQPLTLLINGYDDGMRFSAESNKMLKEIYAPLRKSFEAPVARPEIRDLHKGYMDILKEAELSQTAGA